MPIMEDKVRIRAILKVLHARQPDFVLTPFIGFA